MRKTNRKGFTIVELVIVIAVIAILAGVLIPTFASIVAKANLSNDKSFVRNMNTTLAAENALKKFESAGDAIDALNRNGFTGKYNTYSTNFHYCYSLENNKMYLLDASNKVVYPEENVDKSTLWGLYTDNRVSITGGVTKYIAMTNITNSAHYNDVFAEGEYTIDLNGYFLAVESSLTNVTAINGIVISGGVAGNGANASVEFVPDVEINHAEINNYQDVNDGDDTVITISNKIFNGKMSIYPGEQNYLFDGCYFYTEGVNVDDISGYDGAKVTFKNCHFIGNEGWAILAHGSVDVTDCTFSNLATRGAVQVQENSENIVVNISGCTFDGTNGEYPIVRFVGRDSRIDASRTTGFTSLTISDCNFTALNKATGIIGFSGTGSALYNYTGAEGQPTVTFSGNKFGEIDGKYLAGGAEGNTLGTLLAASAK